MDEQQKQYTIYVVEDERALLDAVTEKLLEKGFNVITSKTAEGVLLKLNELPDIDLFWLDHYLPGDLNGIELVARIRKIKKYEITPIIIVSNVGWSGRVLSYTEVGISKYFIKANYSLDQIIEEMLKLLDEKTKDQ